jgi:flavorubredoxin
MQTNVTEIADRIYLLSTYLAEAGPGGFTFNQFLIDAEQPLLFHTGLRNTFPSVSEAVATIVPLAKLRWITFGHFEADECGAMNHFLAAAPDAVVAHGEIGVMLSVMDQADRMPRALRDGEVLDLGGKRVRRIDTPHVPHGWDAGLLFEETTGTLLAGDLFTRGGAYPALAQRDILEEAIDFELHMPYSAITARTAPTIHALAALNPTTLGLMHNSAYTGDCAAALHGLATWYGSRLEPVAT